MEILLNGQRVHVAIFTTAEVHRLGYISIFPVKNLHDQLMSATSASQLVPKCWTLKSLLCFCFAFDKEEIV